MNSITNGIRLIVLLTGLACGWQSIAAEFSVGPNGKGISIEGEIRPGDYEVFRDKWLLPKVLSRTRVDIDAVYLNSPGGSVRDALKFGALFSENLSTTFVLRGNRCYSACTIIWAGGADRMLEIDAHLGFHRLSSTSKDVDIKKSKAQIAPIMQTVTAYFREVGFPTLLIDKMNETPPSDMFLVDLRWLLEHKLDRTVAVQPAYLDVVEKQCGTDPTLALSKQNRAITSDDRQAYLSWALCGEGIKDANREIAYKKTIQVMMKSYKGKR